MLGIIGATGAVGVEIVEVVYTWKLPLTKLVLFGPEQSAGKTVDTAYGPMKVEPFSVTACHQCQIVLMALCVIMLFAFVPSASGQVHKSKSCSLFDLNAIRNIGCWAPGK